jgi:hypothetical protein
MPKPRIAQWLLAVFVAVIAVAAQASFHEWRVNQIYSNADGTVQYILFHEIAGADGENFLAGHELNVTQGNVKHSFTFMDDLPSSATANGYFLVATQGFANLGIVVPDFIVQNGFLFVGGGTIEYGAAPGGYYMMPTGPVDTLAYAALPTDGVTAVTRDGTPVMNSPRNFNGATGTIGGPAVSPQTGWWWNASESGRGYFIERRGNNLFFAAYLYASGGGALWTISAGPMSSSSMYTGSLAVFSNGQTLTGPYVAPMQGMSPGMITLAFSDATHGTITWPGGVVAIERFDYAGLASPVTASAPETGWWWYGAESGRGFSLETQGSTVFVAGYMYDANGNPVWYISVGTIDTSGVYHGTWAQYANGQTMTGGYQPPTLVSGNVGALTLQFADKQNGTLTLPDGRMIPITRFLF